MKDLRDSNTRAFAKVVLIAALFAVLTLPNLANAQISCGSDGGAVSSSATAFCGSVFGSSTVIGNLGTGSLNSLIDISMLLILLMLNVVAILYLLGYAFKVEKLTRFARTEIGEIVVTGIVVIIFIGGFAPLTTTLLFLSPISQTALQQSTFSTDCTSLAAAGAQTIYDIVYLYGVQESLMFFSGLNYGFSWSYWGIQTVSPLGGLSQAVGTVNIVTSVAFALAGLNLGVAYIIGFFYALLPLFFFLGIVFRSFPWTRAAGGAFLGMFLGFFVVFPLLINMLLGSVSVATFCAQSYSAASAVSVAQSNPLNAFSFFPSYGDLGYGAISGFITSILGYLFYIVIAVIISFVIAYDFMEIAGDFLGAPSLSSQHALRNVI